MWNGSLVMLARSEKWLSDAGDSVIFSVSSPSIGCRYKSVRSLLFGKRIKRGFGNLKRRLVECNEAFQDSLVTADVLMSPR